MKKKIEVKRVADTHIMLLEIILFTNFEKKINKKIEVKRVADTHIMLLEIILFTNFDAK